MTTNGTGSGSSDGATTGATALCDSIAVSLVVDREAPMHSAQDVERVAAFLDALTEQSGAEVLVLPNSGVEDNPMGPCTDGGALAGGLTIRWGHGAALEPGTHDALACVFDVAAGLPSDVEPDGDWMFSGLMFPLLEHGDWPPPDTDLAMALLFAEQDDDQFNMYARPGMTSEAYLRLGASNDRRRATALTLGQGGDELATFALAMQPHSAYADFDDGLQAALDAWLPRALIACDEHDFVPEPEPPGGCSQIDVLFVIDGSLSMAEEQAALRGEDGSPPVFAEFTDALLAELGTLEDVRVGVVSAEPGDVVLHTHRDQPWTPPSPDTDCGLELPWVSAPSPGFAEQFACIGATRAISTDETTVRNAIEALENPANAGFVREDSLLFVVLLTDEDTQDFDTAMSEMHERLLAVVGGEAERLVVLAITGDPGLFELPLTTCSGPYGTATPGRRINSILSTFQDRGLMQDICGGDLASRFAEVLDDIVDSCLDWHPEG